MRWFVEISTFAQGGAQTIRVCVEAPQWQPALQKARALRGDDGALNNFSIELLDDGYRAVDPATRTRYAVRKAPAGTQLTRPEDVQRALAANAAKEAAKEGGSPASIAKPKPVVPPPSARLPNTEAKTSPEIPVAKRREISQSYDYSALGKAVAQEQQQAQLSAASKATPAPLSVPKGVDKPPATLPTFKVVSVRAEDPSERSPLTYREQVYAVEEGTQEDDAKRLVLDRFADVRVGIEEARPGRLVNLAVFDHAFQGKPLRRPLVTLTWKDWRGEPELRFPARDGLPSTPSGSGAPPPMPPSKPHPEVGSPPKTKPAPGKVGARFPAAPPRPTAPSRPATPRRLSGDELIAELFEAFGDLQFLRDPLEGADFVLALVLEKLPCAVGLIYFFDIDKREFVIVRQTGSTKSALLHRIPERSALAHRAMQSRRAVVVSDATRDGAATDERWKAIGIMPTGIVVAPVESNGRYLGLIEIADPLDGRQFSDDDGHALTYIGQQFANFLADRGVIVEPDRVLETSKRSSSP